MLSPEADQQGCGRPARLDSIRGCRSSWCGRSCGLGVPGRYECRIHPREGAWQSCGGACDWAGGELVARTGFEHGGAGVGAQCTNPDYPKEQKRRHNGRLGEVQSLVARTVPSWNQIGGWLRAEPSSE